MKKEEREKKKMVSKEGTVDITRRNEHIRAEMGPRGPHSGKEGENSPSQKWSGGTGREGNGEIFQEA